MQPSWWNQVISEMKHSLRQCGEGPHSGNSTPGWRNAIHGRDAQLEARLQNTASVTTDSKCLLAELDCYHSFHLNRLAIEQKWLIFPLLYCLHSSIGENRVPGNWCHLGNMTIAADFHV